MRPARRRRRRLAIAVLFAIAFVAYFFLARGLAVRDPISEVLLGYGGLALPAAILVLVLRFAFLVVLPVYAAMVTVRILLEKLARP